MGKANRHKGRSSHAGATVAALAALAIMVTAVPARAEQVSFADGPDDAYRVPGTVGSPPAAQPPNPLLSDPTADILEAGFATVTTSKGNPHNRSYTASMTLTGPTDPDYSYVVAGRFGSDCQLYHFLTPGITSFANAFCGSGDERRFVGRISGSAVTDDGTTLSATYTYMSKKLPPELSSDPQLGPLFAFTCVSGLGGLGCHTDEVLDYAFSESTFTI